ncbi:MAG: hypothetical protein IJH04_10010 [Eggerthellaceae bacterium]|nr:hypothetical protein [Eggerthellaceae bacterium]
MSESANEKPRKRRGDRFDATRVRELDGMHVIIPRIFPNRCDNEAFIEVLLDITNLEEWRAKKNEGIEEFPYSLFHCVVTAALKVLYLRPLMNRFICKGVMYQRDECTAAFTVKTKFSDDGEEGLAFLHSKPDWTIDDVHEEIRRQVYHVRVKDAGDASMDAINSISKLPNFVMSFITWACRKLDQSGKVPRSLIATDPYYSSVLLSNVGSIKLDSGYHHLGSWGTNSFFILMGERKKRPFFNEDGTYEMRESLQLGITIDERLADGYYYSKTIRLMKKLVECPELLERPLAEEVEY